MADSLKIEIVKKILDRVEFLEGFSLPSGPRIEKPDMRTNLSTTLRVKTPTGPRYFEIKVTEH